MRADDVDVVYGVQAERKGDWLERSAGRLFFGVFNWMLTHPIPVNVVTARLMTSRYVKALVSHQERELCLAGLWVITGFAQRPIARPERQPADLRPTRPASESRSLPTRSPRSATGR